MVQGDAVDQAIFMVKRQVTDVTDVTEKVIAADTPDLACEVYTGEFGRIILR